MIQTMQTAFPYIAIVALVISLCTLGVSIANYKKSKRDAFIQRRDRLAQAISDLSARNTEVQLISARYEIVAIKRAALPLQGERADKNKSQIDSINRAREGIEKGIKDWEETIKRLRSIYSRLTHEKAAPLVERYIALVQLASDDVKGSIGGFLSSLHILETTNQLIETNLAETDKLIKQIHLDFEREMKNLGT